MSVDLCTEVEAARTLTGALAWRCTKLPHRFRRKTESLALNVCLNQVINVHNNSLKAIFDVWVAAVLLYSMATVLGEHVQVVLAVSTPPKRNWRLDAVILY